MRSSLPTRWDEQLSRRWALDFERRAERVEATGTRSLGSGGEVQKVFRSLLR